MESESFPVLMNEAEEIMLILRQRDWLREGAKFLSDYQKYTKIQIKKNAKKLLSQGKELELENDH